MPYRWDTPETFLIHNEVEIYHVYRGPYEVQGYHYTTDMYDDDGDSDNGCQFDVRDIPRPPERSKEVTPGYWETEDGQQELVRYAIEQGWLKQDESPEFPEQE